MARAVDFDLARELQRPGFTPARRDAPALVALIAEDAPAATRAAPALAGLGAAGRTALLAALAGDAGADEAPAGRLVTALGLVARTGDAEARAALIARTTDPRVRVRRAAIVALGKLGTDARAASELSDVRAALIARWDAADVPADERRALAEALGKIGGDDARSRLAALDPAGDRELARRRERALLMAGREAQRDAASTIVTDAAPPAPLRVRLRCRAGLAELLAAELATTPLGQRAGTDTAPELVRVRDDAVDVSLAAPWSTLFASRLWASAAIRIPLARRRDLETALVDTLTSAPVRELLRAWTRGAIRWRLGVAHGHQRALIWRVAKEVTRRAPELVNDPAQTTWDIRLDEDARTLELSPRRADDPRFAYRVAEVPAASHPTVAAALAYLAAPRPDDRVWDPFCGSALELVECARRGPVRALLGTDLDDTALAAARANLDAAGVRAELRRADARSHAPGPVELVVTNPPLGSRVHVDAAALLESALPGFARALAPGGRLVWITPAAARTRPALERLGLVCARSLPVDLGGVRGRLERWDKPALNAARGRRSV